MGTSAQDGGHGSGVCWEERLGTFDVPIIQRSRGGRWAVECVNPGSGEVKAA